ncbi:MAG: antibiotic biosynthesis monooxygenase [Pseudomonadota bacterium]
MIVVIFEVTPHENKEERYFDIASQLRQTLEQMDGFISVERFQSLTRPGTFLSMSYWRDEESVRRWRCMPEHRAGQIEGRASVFADYRIRVASVVRDYTMTQRAAAPHDANQAFHIKNANL